MSSNRKATTCAVGGCKAGGYMTRGLCKMHYARLRRHGDTGAAGKMHAVSWAGATCTVDGCEKAVKATGLCLAHYKRKAKYGSPTGRPHKPTAAESFAAKITPGDGGCWQWIGTMHAAGYGVFRHDGQQWLAHRWSFEHHIAPVPDELVIDHLCRNRACVNPWHMEPVTNEENLRRGLGYSLQNGMRSCCVNGHEYTPENTYTDPTKGTVRCRTCARDRQRKAAA